MNKLVSTIDSSATSPTVSVIIPAFNVAQYLPEAIDSVMSQTCPVAEIIVVDDGSHDDILEALSPYEGIVTYLRQENTGPAAARNRGAQSASGEFLAFLDGDDLWLPSKIEEQLSLVNERVRFVFCWKEEFFDTEPSRTTLIAYPPSVCHNPIEAFFHCWFASPSTVLVARHLFLACGGFREDLFDCEDEDLWIRLSALTQFRLVCKPLVKYRVRENSICRCQQPLRRALCFIDPLILNLELIQHHLQLKEEQVTRRIGYVYGFFCHRFLKNTDYLNALRLFFASLSSGVRYAAGCLEWILSTRRHFHIDIK